MDIKVIALSIVALLVVGTVLYVGLGKIFYIDLTKSSWKEAKAGYPQLAEKLNLSFKPGELDYHIGEINGTYSGCEIVVKPDESATIEVRFQGTPELFLSSVDPENTEPFPGMVRFDTGSSSFDQYFQTRFAVLVLSSGLKEQADKLQFADAFVKKWSRPIQRFDITRNGLEIRFRYGGQTYIPVDVLESILPDLCRFSKTFEALVMLIDDSGLTEHNDRSADAGGDN